MMKQYMQGIAKGVLGILVLLLWGQERMGITMASSVSGNIIDVSGNNVPDVVTVYDTSVSDNGIVQLQVPEKNKFCD